MKIKAQLFTLDMAVAMFFLVIILQSQSGLYLSQSNSQQIGGKSIGEDILNVMEKTGYIDQVAGGGVSSNAVASYMREMLPPTMNANFSLTSYRYASDFEVRRSVNSSTGTFSTPFTASRRVTLIPRNGDDDYILTEIRVGYS